MRRFLLGTLAAACVTLAACAVPAAAHPTAAAGDAATPRKIGHVWIFVFENTNYASVTASSMPYFTQQAKRGVTLSQMYAVGHASLDNYIAMTSGYQPNPKTQADCFNYDCVYGRGADDNIANQLDTAGLTWKAYMDGAPTACPKPAKQSAPDPYVRGYATRHDPFMYYQSIVDDTARCTQHVVPFTQMASDLAAGTVANYTFISPDTCHDAHDSGDAHCRLRDADAWLAANLPPILASDAYRQDGAVFLTFDESAGDNTGCCGTPGGGHIATAILSPRLAHPGTTVATKYSLYSLLRTTEDAFDVPCLRHACDTTTASMLGLFKDASPTSTSTTTAAAGSSVPSSSAPASGSAAPSTHAKSKSKAALVWVIAGIGALMAVGALIATKRVARAGSEE